MEHIAEWDIHVYLFEQADDANLARVVLNTGANELRGEGRSRRAPEDPPVPEIGDELAVGRALVDLGNQLLAVASEDAAALGRR